MAKIMTLRVPKSACVNLISGYETGTKTPKQIKVDIKTALMDALNEELSPSNEKVPLNADAERVNFSIDHRLTQKLLAIAAQHELSPSLAAQRLIIAKSRQGAVEAPYPEKATFLRQTIEQHGRNLGMDMRYEQGEFYAQIHESLGDGKIGICEAGTGVGKTLAILLASHERLSEAPVDRLLIAVPTIALIEQFASSAAKLSSVIDGFPRTRPILGKQEFVSREDLEMMLNSGHLECSIDQIEAIEKWIGENGESTTAIPLPWCMSHFRTIAPDFPADSICVHDTTNPDDPGFQSYESQFEIEEDLLTPEIIICTHSMLAIDVRRRMQIARNNEEYIERQESIKELFDRIKEIEDAQARKVIHKEISELQAKQIILTGNLSFDRGHLPSHRFLIVDEAHLLEQNFSSSLSDQVSLRALDKQLKDYINSGGNFPKRVYEAIHTKINQLSDLANTLDSTRLNLAGYTSTIQHARGILGFITEEATRVLKKPTNTGLHRAWARIRYQLSILKQATNPVYQGTIAHVEYSPIRVNPRVFIGRSKVERYLKQVWTNIQAGACVSATLYLPKGDGISSAYIRHLLALSSERTIDFNPVIPSWIFKQTQGIWLPEKIAVEAPISRLWLRPPSTVDRSSGEITKEIENQWINELAGALSYIYETSEGGVLVLMTSYETIKQVMAQLPDPLKKRTITATKNWNLMNQRRRFLEIAKSGEKALWLAVGGAWAGLDVGGGEAFMALFGKSVPAAEDNVLTDLVIPKLPFRTNQSLTHQVRVEQKNGMVWELRHVLHTLKQGIGRLVRREGTPGNRRIFLLDGRINDDKFASINIGVRRMIAGYRQFTLKPEESEIGLN